MTAPKEGRTSVLATLTAEVMQDKKDAARKLTPVAGEAGAPVIPNDTGIFMSNEALHTHAQQLRKFAADAIAISDGLDELVNEPSETPVVVDLDAARKAKEAEGDARAKAREDEAEAADEQAVEAEEKTDFAADFAAKAAAAQASVFKPEAAAPGEWVCPVHGGPVTDRVSGKGRPYIGCHDLTCTQFKR